jgi:hypothetical protein
VLTSELSDLYRSLPPLQRSPRVRRALRPAQRARLSGTGQSGNVAGKGDLGGSKTQPATRFVTLKPLTPTWNGPITTSRAGPSLAILCTSISSRGTQRTGLRSHYGRPPIPRAGYLGPFARRRIRNDDELLGSTELRSWTE